jgi:hypothetical protein
LRIFQLKRDFLLIDLRPIHLRRPGIVRPNVFPAKYKITLPLIPANYYVADMPNPPAWGRGSQEWKETVVILHHVFGNAGFTDAVSRELVPLAPALIEAGDLDNYARLTCLWGPDGQELREPWLEAMFSTTAWAVARAERTSRVGPPIWCSSQRANASVSQRRAVSGRPLSNAQRPRWRASQTNPAGRAVEGAAS